MWCGRGALRRSLQWRKVADYRPFAVIIADGWGRIPGIQSGLGLWHDFRLTDFQSSRSAWPDRSSSTHGNSSNFHFIHFCLLAGDSLAHHLVKVLASFPQLLMKRRFLIVTSILSSHICLWLNQSFSGLFYMGHILEWMILSLLPFLFFLRQKKKKTKKPLLCGEIFLPYNTLIRGK